MIEKKSKNWSKKQLETFRRNQQKGVRKIIKDRVYMDYPVPRMFYLNDVELGILYSSCQNLDTIAKLTGKVQGVKDYFIVDLLIRGVLFAKEVCALNYESINFKDEIVVYRRNGNICRRKVDPQLIEHIKNYCEDFEIYSGAILRYGDRRLKISGVRKAWSRSLKNAGMNNVSLWASRHTGPLNVYMKEGNLRAAANYKGVDVCLAKKLYFDIKKSEFDEMYHIKTPVR